MTNILETVVFAEGEEAVDTQAQTAETTETTSTDADQVAEANPVMSTVVSILPLVLIIELLDFMMIRPQRKKEKETKEMINSMKVGDKVVTIGGICGKVARIKDEFVFIETGNIGTPDEKSVIKMERDAVKTVESNKN
ncbi:MAG: preprotein translocase subunit YajC, partial [Firmicutes bacterium]|nr:preprotein translocase subunit YajC [Bacillota bacterium]